MRSSVRFSPRMNWWFYSALVILFLSGVVWLALHYWADRQGVFYSPLEPRLMKIHGAAAMLSLLVLGALIPTHMRRAWSQRRNRLTAIALVSICLSMILSGYGLYYCGSDEWRQWISGFHSVTGCSLPLALVWHILSGRTSRRVHKPIH